MNRTHGTLMSLVAIGAFALSACDDDKPGRKGGAQGGKPALDFSALDTNADGQVTESEAGKNWRKLSRGDTDRDGSISKAEFEALPKRRSRPAD